MSLNAPTLSTARVAERDSRRTFTQTVDAPLLRRTATTIQVNVGKRCNQACVHCHVDAGLKRTAMMTSETVNHVVRLLNASGRSVKTLDLTGGAREILHPETRQKTA